MSIHVQSHPSQGSIQDDDSRAATVAAAVGAAAAAAAAVAAAVSVGTASGATLEASPPQLPLQPPSPPPVLRLRLRDGPGKRWAHCHGTPSVGQRAEKHAQTVAVQAVSGSGVGRLDCGTASTTASVTTAALSRRADVEPRRGIATHAPARTEPAGGARASLAPGWFRRKAAAAAAAAAAAVAAAPRNRRGGGSSGCVVISSRRDLGGQAGYGEGGGSDDGASPRAAAAAALVAFSEADQSAGDALAVVAPAHRPDAFQAKAAAAVEHSAVLTRYSPPPSPLPMELEVSWALMTSAGESDSSAGSCAESDTATEDEAGKLGSEFCAKEVGKSVRFTEAEHAQNQEVERDSGSFLSHGEEVSPGMMVETEVDLQDRESLAATVGLKDIAAASSEPAQSEAAIAAAASVSPPFVTDDLTLSRFVHLLARGISTIHFS